MWLLNKTKYFSTFLAGALIVVFVVASSAVSLHRYWQYESGYYDFGIFDTVLWKVSKFKPPIVDHFVVENKLIFADHFYPSLFLIAPLYWFTDHQEIMFVAQAISVGLAGLLLYLTAITETKSKNAAIAILISFFAFAGLQNALWFDIHEVTFMVLPLTLCMYAISTNNRKLFWISFLITLGFKESSFVVLTGLSTYILLTKKTWSKTAILSMLASLIYGILVIKFIIPFFLGGSYFYSEVFNFNWFSPITYWNVFFDSTLKLKTLLNSFLSFGFLPLISIPLWPSYILHFLTRFTSTSIRWDIGLHYSAELAPFLSLGCIYFLKTSSRIKSKIPILILSAWLVFISLYIFRFKLHGPILLAFNPVFYEQTNKVNYPNQILPKIPPTASVMAQQNLAVHLNHRDRILILRDNYYQYQPDYIVMDNRDGLNPNHFWGISNPTALLTQLEKDSDYRLIDQFQTVKLFCRVSICSSK